MSDPVIPERCSACDKAAKHAYSDATTPGFFHEKCDYHRLLAAESKVAEQADTFLGENRAMLKDLNDWVEKAKHAEKVVTQQAAIIERLTGVLSKAGQFVDIHSESWYVSGQALLAEIRAASEQEPK